MRVPLTGGDDSLDIQFRTDDLREEAEDERKARRAYGTAIGRKYLRAIKFLESCETKQHIREARSWRFHALEGQLKGQYAIDLNKAKGVRLRMSFPDDQSLCIEKVDTRHYE